MDDWQLLQNYWTEKSETAFHALVERYAGMVYQAALRQTGNPHAAEEVAQEVFIALAQKAGRISRQATLYGWLFRATRFAAMNQARKNANRQRYEQEATSMQPTIVSDDPASLWEHITPHLNDALDALPAEDRELVMIRFFGNKSHRDVAEELGISEETARKRISRAIERLRLIFTRRGIVVSSVALAAAFATHGSQSAPTDAASSWAKVAMAKGAAGATATTGFFKVLTGIKTPALFAGLAGLLLLGGVIFTFLKLSAHDSPVAQAIAPKPPVIPIASTNLTAPLKPTEDAESNVLIAAVLDKVKAALHDPIPTTNFPNTNMVVAITELGGKKKAAVPILESALNDAEAQVRLRAMDGLGAVGPEAGETAPLLLGILQAGGFGKGHWIIYHEDIEIHGQHMKVGHGMEGDCVLLFTLGQINPSPTCVSELARIVQNSTSACQIVYSEATGNSPGFNWLLPMAGGNTKALNDAFRPLLKDAHAMVRRAAASCLITSLGDAADVGVFPPVLEMLNSGDDAFLRFHGLILLEQSAKAENPHRMIWLEAGQKSDLTAPRLDPYLNDTVTALNDVAQHSNRRDLQSFASRILAALSLDFQKYYPQLAATLHEDDEVAAFISTATHHAPSMPEIREGLKRFPKAAPKIAEWLALQPRDHREILPVLQESLTVLLSMTNVTRMDQSVVVENREKLVNAMQKIAPERPKLLFTGKDTYSIYTILMAPDVRNDPDRRAKVSAARKLAKWPTGGPFDVPPDEIRSLLAAVKDADAATYEGLVAKVKKIDPHFFEGAAVDETKN